MSDSVVSDKTIKRPSQAILNSGLAFDHFIAPFSIVTPDNSKIEGFITVGDALDFAVVRQFREGGAWYVMDAEAEHVYTVES